MEKIEEYVLSRDQMHHLQELGLDTSDAALSWIRFVRKSRKKKKSKWKIRTTTAEKLNRFNVPDLGHYQGVPTYTLQEILDKLPCGMSWDTWQLQITLGVGGDEMEYNDGDGYSPHREVDENLFDNLLNKAYKTLCWVLENGYLKEEKK